MEETPVVVILMNIVAFLLIAALLGLIAVVVLFALTAKSYIRLGKKAVAAVQRPKNSALQIYNTGRGFALGAANRVSNAKSHVLKASAEVSLAVRNLKIVIGDLILEFTKASETVEDTIGNRGPARQGMDLMRQFTDVMRQMRN